MASKSNGSGRLYMMAGIIATVIIPLAILMPGISDRFNDKAQEDNRLIDVYSESESETKNESRSASGQSSTAMSPTPSVSNGPVDFGAAGNFGMPTMDPNSSLANYHKQPEQNDSVPTSIINSKPGTGQQPVRISGEKAAISGAEAIGLPVLPSRKTVGYPLDKSATSPRSEDPLYIRRVK